MMSRIVRGSLVKNSDWDWGRSSRFLENFKGVTSKQRGHCSALDVTAL